MNDDWDFASVNSSSNILMDTSETNCRVSGSESASKKPPSCKAYATDAKPFSFKTETISLPPKDAQYVKHCTLPALEGPILEWLEERVDVVLHRVLELRHE